jgi:hypothetical protein
VGFSGAAGRRVGVGAGGGAEVEAGGGAGGRIRRRGSSTPGWRKKMTEVEEEVGSTGHRDGVMERAPYIEIRQGMTVFSRG